MSKKLFDNPKQVVYLIALFVALLLYFFSLESRGSELSVEGGSAYVRGETPYMGLNVRWPRQGPANTDWEAGFILSGQSSYHRDNPNAVTLYGMIVDGYGPFEIGLGFAYTNVDWEYTCRETFALKMGWRFSDRLYAGVKHFSSAGSCKPNAGRDFIGVSWRF